MLAEWRSPHLGDGSHLVRRGVCTALVGLLWLLVATPGHGTGETAEAPRWYVHDHELPLVGWRARLILTAGGAWLGGSRSEAPSRQLLYRLADGEWLPVLLPIATGRAYVLDVDPAGTLWVCSYAANTASTYDGLRIDRLVDGRWHHETVRPGIWPQAMDMVSAQEGWVAGNRGLFLHYRDGSWTRTSLQGPGVSQELNFLDLEMAGAGAGWAVGGPGLVARFEDGRWHRVAVPEALRKEHLSALDVTPEGTLWVASTAGYIARLDEAGWYLEQPVAADLTAITMRADDEGWAVGRSGTIVRYDGGHWHPQPAPTTADLFDVAMSSAGEGWIVGVGTLLHSTSLTPPLLRHVSRPERYPMLRSGGHHGMAADLDEDGDLDYLYLVDSTFHWFPNTGEPGFSEAREIPFAVPSHPFHLSMRSAGDIDGDGDLDLYLLGEPATEHFLFRNRGDGSFEEAGAAAGLGPIDGALNTAYLLDLDVDGDLDLYIARGERLSTPLGNLLLRNDGFGRFGPAVDAGGGKGSEKLVLWGDLDGDLDLDAVLPGYNSAETVLYRNDGAGRLLDVTQGSGLDNALEDGLFFQGHLLDLDRDGDLDLLLLGDQLYVFLNDGAARFHLRDDLFPPLSSDLGVISTMSAVGDLDHDGFPDVLLQPSVDGRSVVKLFAHRADGRYHDVAREAGLRDLKGDSAVFADWDDDGDLDVIIAGKQRTHVLANGRDDDRFLKIRARGVRSNRRAIGSRVRIYTAGHRGDPAFLRGHQQVGVGQNPSGLFNLDELHFGLPAPAAAPGQPSLPDRYDVEVTFPNGRQVVANGVAPGRTLTLYEYPFGIRHLLRAAAAARRAFAFADKGRELAKLGLVLLAMTVAWRWSARWKGGALLHRAATIGVLVLAYLLAAGALAGSDAMAAQLAPPLGFVALLALIALADRQLTAWRRARYLGPYRLEAQLGEGGMGIVYRAQDVVARRVVALKVLHPRLLREERNRIRFLREARVMTSLSHPNIARVFDAGELNGRGFISMELLEGVSFKEQIRQHGPASPAAVLAIGAAVCDALGSLHAQGMVHRDIKSENIFICKPPAHQDESDDLGARVRLMDFGLARAADMTSITDRQTILGTLAYMPPEQVRGGVVDARSDLYALGAVLYEGLSGRLPFSDEEGLALVQKILDGEPHPLRSLRPEVSPRLETIILQLLARQPDDRYPSAAALAAALAPPPFGSGEEAATPQPIPRREPSGVEHLEGLAAVPWQQAYQQAQRAWAAHQTSEAQIAMVECIQALKVELQNADGAVNPANPSRRDIAAVLELMEKVHG